MKNLSYKQALEYVYKRIPTSAAKKFPGQLGLARMAYVLEQLGSPQEKYKTIHVAGTSGKGSCVTLASATLSSQGIKTGVTLSPHIVEIRERCQINGKPISKDKFAKYLSQITPIIEAVDKSLYGRVTYFETLTALAFYSFWKEGIKVAIIETGLGGTFDATNVIKRKDKVVIISRVGLDHTAILGNTLSSIAAHKAGIIQMKNRVVTVDQAKDVINQIKSQCKKMKAGLVVLSPKREYRVLSVNRRGTQVEVNLPTTKLLLTLGLIGAYQAENFAPALQAALFILSDLKRKLNKAKLIIALKQISFPGRFEVKNINSRPVVFDGAHNAQKMEMFVSSLTKVFIGKKFTFLLAFKHDKDVPSMLKYIIPHAKKIIITTFCVEGQDFLQTSTPPQKVGLLLKGLSFNSLEVVNDPKQAFLQLIKEKDP